MMLRSFGFFVLLAAVCTLGGCSNDGATDARSRVPTGRVQGGPSQDEIFAPFQGRWVFESRTWDPPIDGNRISGGPDLTFDGHIIKIADGPSCMRLCQTRKVDGGIECEAWREEDINDPGDMQRAQCKLRIDGDKLQFHWRMVDTEDYTNDPIIAAADYVPPPRPTDANSPWWLEVYTRKTGN